MRQRSWITFLETVKSKLAGKVRCYAWSKPGPMLGRVTAATVLPKGPPQGLGFQQGEQGSL